MDTREKLLRDVREWVRLGLPEDEATLRRFGLITRVERIFGDWKAAVVASRAERPATPACSSLPEDPTAALDTLLGLMSDRMVSRLTGRTQRQVAARRWWLGRPIRVAAVDARIAASPQLGAIPDRALAAELGTTSSRVSAVRKALGIASSRSLALVGHAARERIAAGLATLEDEPTRVVARERFLAGRSRADVAGELGRTEAEVLAMEVAACALLGLRRRLGREWVSPLSESQRARVSEGLAELRDPRWATVLTGRHLSEPPRKLKELSAELGVSCTTIQKMEARALRVLGIYEGPPDHASSNPQVDEELRQRVRAGLTALSKPRWVQVLRDRFVREPPLSRRAIAADLGVSADRVREIERIALARLGIEAVPAPPYAGRASYTVVLSDEARARLVEGLPTLPARLADVLRERFLTEAPSTRREVANRLGIAVDEVGAAERRALARLGIGEVLRKPKPRETKPRDTKPRDTKPRDTKPRDTKPRDTKPRDTKPREQARPSSFDPSPLATDARAVRARERLERLREARASAIYAESGPDVRYASLEAVARDLRRWIAAGLPTDPATRERHGLDALAQHWFGSWPRALEAAGPITAEAAPIELPTDPHEAFDRILSVLSISSVARITGARTEALRQHRQARNLGPLADPQRDRLLESGLLGVLTDVEVGRQLGVTTHVVRRVRTNAGIPRVAPRPKRLFAFDAERDGPRLRRAMRDLEERDQHILSERYLRDPPATLREIADRLGVTGERVRQLERRALQRAGLVD